MKLITRDTDYAIRAVISLAQSKKKVVSVEALVAELGIPKAFLRRLLQLLSKEKILLSQKGKNGGFILSKPLKLITVIDIMRVFQGPFKMTDCSFKKKKCPNVRRCQLRKSLLKAEEGLYNHLNGITLASLT